MKKTFLFSLFALLFITISCSRNESSTEESSSSSSETRTETSVKINVVDKNQTPQKGIVVMMFKKEVNPEKDSMLPDIEMKATSDANGLAYFDLSKYHVDDNQTYYFAAFRKNNEDSYTLISNQQPRFKIKEHSIHTTTIVIKTK